MSRPFSVWPALLLLVQAAPSPESSENAFLARLEHRVLQAEVRGDAEFFRRLELCGYRFVGWFGEELTKAKDLAAVAEPRSARVEAFGVDDLIVRRYDRTALVWGRDTMVLVDKQGNRRVSRSRFTHVYLRHGGRWRLAAAHASPLPAP